MHNNFFKTTFYEKVIKLKNKIKTAPVIDSVNYFTSDTRNSFYFTSIVKGQSRKVVNISLIHDLRGSQIKMSSSDTELPLREMTCRYDRLGVLDICINTNMPNLEELVVFFLYKLFFPIKENMDLPKDFMPFMLTLRGDDLQADFFDKLHDYPEIATGTFYQISPVDAISNISLTSTKGKSMTSDQFKKEFLLKLMSLSDRIKVEPPITYHLDFTDNMFFLSSPGKNKLEIVNVCLVSNFSGSFIKLSTSDNEKPIGPGQDLSYRMNKLDIYINTRMSDIEELVFFFLFKLFYPISKNIEVPKSFNGGYLLLNGDNLQEEFFDKLHRFPEIATCSFKQMTQLYITSDPL